MRLILFLLLAATVHAQPAALEVSDQAPRLNAGALPTAYVGGKWYDGERFVARDTVWADRGVFVAGPLRTARVVDLEDAFVVPPFGDAHYHGLDGPAYLAASDSAFVAEGIFYVLNPNGLRSDRDRVRGMETVIDVAYANGGITAPGAHPVPAYERQALGLSIQEMYDRADEVRESRLSDGDAYHLALTPDDLDAVWPRVLEGGPDLVKVYLRFSEEWAEGTPERPRGLSPAVVAEVVRRARQAGLRVIAHVETAADARNALEAGVDALAHVPAPNAINDGEALLAGAEAYVMDDALLEGLAAQGVSVTPTLSYVLATLRYVPEAHHPSDEVQAAARQFHRDVYRRLARAGVPIAFGADAAGSLTSRDEADYAVEVGGLTATQALRSLSVDTPRAVFPGRAIGALEVGAEASLLALECEPLQDWTCTDRIVRREKQGQHVGPPVPRRNPDAPSTAYVGGQWWDGEQFVLRDTTWAEAGVFRDALPRGRLARTVDLEGRYVVPPYGDAHTHMLSDVYQGPGQAEQFEAEGVFYALVITDRHSWAEPMAESFAGPGSIDVAYTHGGLTSEGTHPTQVYEWQALRLVGQEITPERQRQIHQSRLAKDDAYWALDDLEAVDAAWDRFLAHEPDAVKVYLLDSANDLGEPTSGMTGLPSGRGLSPDVLAEVVRRAAAAGLPVYAHVETAADVRLALEAGVGGLAHLVGYSYRTGTDGPYALEDATIAAAGDRGWVVIPTAAVMTNRFPDRPARTWLATDLVRRTAQRLHAAGARIALGADRWNQTSKAEADFMERHGFFDRATILDLWTRETSQVVFPGRAIGALEDGYEASLLALECDPLQDWSCTGQIAHREKQGLDLGGAPEVTQAE